MQCPPVLSPEGGAGGETIEALRTLSDPEAGWSTPLESHSPVFASTPVGPGSPLKLRQAEEPKAEVSIADEGEGTWRETATPVAPLAANAPAGRSTSKSKKGKKRR